MRPGPSIALELLAGGTALALSVGGWHSPQLAVLGAGLFLRAGFDLARTRPPNAPPIPLRHALVPPAAGPARSGGRAGWSEGAARVAAWARCDRGADPAQVRLDRDWLAAQLQPPSAASAPHGRPGQPRPAARAPSRRTAGAEQSRPGLAHQQE
jgi:hypothetical protein